MPFFYFFMSSMYYFLRTMIWRGHANFLPTMRSGLSFLHIYVVDLRVPVGCWFKERAVLLFIHLHIPPTCCFLWTIKHTTFLTMRNFSSIVTLINVMAEKNINHKPKGISSRWEFFVIVDTGETWLWQKISFSIRPFKCTS